jgi:uncharacterized delta-60 repeat protein
MRSSSSYAKLVLSGFVASAGLARCVGSDNTIVDSGADTSISDATSDMNTTSDASSDADAAVQTCIFPEAGAPGTLDLAFQAQFYPTVYNGHGLAVDSVGGIYVVGYDSPQSGLGPDGPLCGSVAATVAYAVKMTNSGALDTTFGTNGHLCVPNGTINSAPTTNLFQAVAADPDGTVVAAGFATDFSKNTNDIDTQAFIARITSTGQLQTTFGSGGTLTYNAVANDRSAIFAVALDKSVSPAKIVVAGSNQYFYGSTALNKGWVMRFSDGGTADITFNGGSPVIDTSVNGYFGVAVVDSAIFVTGSTGANQNQQTAVVRKLTSTGVWDPSFNGGSPAQVPLGASNAGQGESVAPLGTGVAVAGPSNLDSYNGGPVAVAGITSTGTVSSSFGTSGTTDLSYDGGPLVFSTTYQLGMMSPDCEGRLLFATAFVANPALDSGGGENLTEMAVARVLTTGALDTAFGTQGVGLAMGFNSSPGSLAVEDPKTGGVVVVLRRRAGMDGQVGLVRLNR